MFKTHRQTEEDDGHFRRFPRNLVLSVGLALMMPGGTQAQLQQHARHALGTINFPVTCSSQAQTEFNRAVALLHHMTYPQAREAFQHVAAIDPHCAMAHWGIAMTLFQPLWPTRPGPGALQQGWQAVERAKTLQPPTEREQLFVAAAEAFFLDPTSSDYWLRIRRWEQAMQKVYQRFPGDSDAAAFYALAHLATIPADKIRELMPIRRPKFCCAFTERTRITRVRCIILFMRMMSRDVSASYLRSRASTSWSRRTIRMRSTCRRISTLGSVIGMASSGEICEQRMLRWITGQATTANLSGMSSVMRSNISSTPIYRSMTTRRPRRSCNDCAVRRGSNRRSRPLFT